MSAFDGNRDGRLERGERSDEAEFRGGDRNRDGALNRAEFARADNPGDFRKADTNRDGLVDAPEFEREEQRERRGDHHRN